MNNRCRRGAVKMALLVALIGVAHAQDAAPSAAIAPLRVLFIGSSLTYTNALPQVVAGLSAQSAEARKIEAVEVTFPAWSLSRHWDSGKALKIVRGERWDFVVLQPGNDFDLQGNSTDLQGKSIELFDAEIRKVGARTILYVLFPRLRSGLIERPEQFYERQEQLATALGALSAPVGPAWTQAVKAGILPSALYDTDGRHPTLIGTYLAACVFFSVIYGSSPEGLRPPWAQGANAPDTAALNSAAWRAVQKVPRMPRPASASN